MKFPPHSTPTGVTAFEQDYLGIKYNRFSPAPVRDFVIEVPTLKLFPAGTLIIEPHVSVQLHDRDIRFRFKGVSENDPSWVSGFRECFHAAEKPNVVYKQQLQLDQPNSIHLPARLEISARIFHLHDRQWCPIIIERLKLQKGEVLDLGRRDFQATFQVQVKVLDAKGQPVEGIGVGSVADGSFWGDKAITDAGGIALPRVPPYSSGRFSVLYHDRPGKTRLEESIPYEVRGEEDAGREFTLQISDQMLSRILK
jgi:hypothetical protein